MNDIKDITPFLSKMHMLDALSMPADKQKYFDVNPVSGLPLNKQAR
ncbi:MAG: hypothetical protein ACFC03_02995 [Candidatus Malihini olakiniferum]